MKRCMKCKIEKPLDAFCKDIARKDGKNPYCRQCVSKYGKDRWTNDAAFRAARMAQSAKWREDNPESVKIIKRKTYLKHEYGITPEDYSKMLEAQGNACAICGVSANESSKYLAVHHNHVTGKIQALLCSNCNTGIGLLQDNPELLKRAIKILNRKGR